MSNYKGCKIELVKAPKSDMTGVGDDWVITDIDGISVGGFRSEAEAKRWCDQHPSRCANSRACNASFKVGDRVVIKGDRPGIIHEVTRVYGDGSVQIDEGTFAYPPAKLILADSASLDTSSSRVSNARFKVGDKVYFYGRPATVKQVIREPDADYILDVQGSDFYAEDDEVTSRNSRVCNSSNPVVRKAVNACAMR